MNVLDPRFGEFSRNAAERQLQDAALRASRQPAGRVAVVLHLSRLAAPAPRPHHRRIARALLQDVAGRHDGQVFALQEGDLVLLCRVTPPGLMQGGMASGWKGSAPDPLALPEIFRRLLRVDVPDPARLVSLWRLEQEAGLLLSYAAAVLARAGLATGGDAPAAEDVVGRTDVLDAIGCVVNTAAISDLLQRQTAVLLTAGRADGMLPIYREVTFSIAALEARIAADGHVGADPFLFRHLATRLDQRMLPLLAAEIGTGRPLDATAGHALPALHLNLTLPGILSPAFARFAATCRANGAAVAVEVSLIEACADSIGFARARALVAETRLTLVLDGVSHLALLLARPWLLRPDLLKLDWSPRLADLPAAEARQIDDALAQIDPARVVLHRAETEAAMRWGMARGIRRFQGRHVDAMLGASRIVSCSLAAACTLRQCIERAAATGVAGRAACGNLPLLDAGARPAERVA